MECNRRTKLSKQCEAVELGSVVRGESEKSLFKGEYEEAREKNTLKISEGLIGVRHKVLCSAATVPAERVYKCLD